jgi:hypothetical protein
MHENFQEKLYYVAHDAVEDGGGRVVIKRLSRNFFERANAVVAYEQLKSEQPRAYVVEAVRFL